MQYTKDAISPLHFHLSSSLYVSSLTFKECSSFLMMTIFYKQIGTCHVWPWFRFALTHDTLKIEDSENGLFYMIYMYMYKKLLLVTLFLTKLFFILKRKIMAIYINTHHLYKFVLEFIVDVLFEWHHNWCN